MIEEFGVFTYHLSSTIIVHHRKTVLHTSKSRKTVVSIHVDSHHRFHAGHIQAF